VPLPWQNSKFISFHYNLFKSVYVFVLIGFRCSACIIIYTAACHLYASREVEMVHGCFNCLLALSKLIVVYCGVERLETVFVTVISAI